MNLRSRYFLKLLLIPFIVGSLDPLVVGEGRVSNTTQPSDGGEKASKEQVLKRVKGLIDTRQLRLTTEDQIRTHFHCLIRSAYTGAEGKKHASNYFVERDGDQVGILACSDDGLPFSYITNDLLIGTDRENPGQLLLHEHINPVLILGSMAKNSTALCDLSFDSRVRSPKIEIDLEDLLRDVTAKAKSARVKDGGRTIQIGTEHGALIEIDLAATNSALMPIRSFFISGTKGESMAIGSLDNGPLESLQVLRISKEDLATLRIPVVTATSAESSRIDVSVREDFGQDAREKDAAEAFLTLFKHGYKPPQRGRLSNPRP